MEKCTENEKKVFIKFSKDHGKNENLKLDSKYRNRKGSHLN